MFWRTPAVYYDYHMKDLLLQAKRMLEQVVHIVTTLLQTAMTVEVSETLGKTIPY
jgi:hypothetical protein